MRESEGSPLRRRFSSVLVPWTFLQGPFYNSSSKLQRYSTAVPGRQQQIDAREARSAKREPFFFWLKNWSHGHASVCDNFFFYFVS